MLVYILGITKRVNKGITNRGQVSGTTKRGKRDYKQGQLKGFQIGTKRLQIGAGISNRDKKISNQGRDYKLGQERLQTRAEISNRGRDYKSVQKAMVYLKSSYLFHLYCIQEEWLSRVLQKSCQVKLYMIYKKKHIMEPFLSATLLRNQLHFRWLPTYFTKFFRTIFQKNTSGQPFQHHYVYTRFIKLCSSKIYRKLVRAFTGHLQNILKFKV